MAVEVAAMSGAPFILGARRWSCWELETSGKEKLITQKKILQFEMEGKKRALHFEIAATEEEMDGVKNESSVCGMKGARTFFS